MNNKKTENLEATRAVRREMARHSVDTSEIQVQCSHGNVTLHGRLRPLRGHEAAFEANAAGLLKALRARPGIRDVNAEWTAIF